MSPFYFAQLRHDRRGTVTGVDLVRQDIVYRDRQIVKDQTVLRTCPTLGEALAEARNLNSKVPA